MGTQKTSSPRSSSDSLRLKRLRDALGYSQRDLANEFRVSHGALGAWESGTQPVPGAVLRLIEIYEDEMQLAGSAAQYFSRLEASRLSRAATFSKLAGSMMLQSAKSWITMVLANEGAKKSIGAHTQSVVARNLIEGLGELKGVALKAGQALGYLQFALPEAQRRELYRLAQTKAMRPAQASGIILEELGALPKELFAEWSPTPFAVASIGQVHRARLKTGEAVAVKVQYPLIAETIEADLRNASGVARISRLLFRGQNVDTFIDELRDQFRMECDYRLEAANHVEFIRLWGARSGLMSRFVIPKVYSAYTTRRVLVTEMMRGQSLEEFAKRASSEARQRAGEIIWRFAYESVLKHGVFHADPHAGNFLFSEEGVAVLDFGCVKRLTPNFLEQSRSILRAAMEGNRDRIGEILIKLGTVVDIERYDLHAHLNMMLQLYKPLCQEEGFRYTREYAEHAWRAVMVNRNTLRANAPKDWFMIFRLLMGTNWILGVLGAEGDFRSRALDLLYEPKDELPRSMPKRMLELMAPSA